MEEARFEVDSSGKTKDKMQYIVNKFEDIQNWCGSRLSPDTDDYWNLMKEELKELSEKEIRYLLDKYYKPLKEVDVKENCEKILDTLRSALEEKEVEQKDKEQKEEVSSKNREELKDMLKDAFKDTDFKNIY